MPRIVIHGLSMHKSTQVQDSLLPVLQDLSLGDEAVIETVPSRVVAANGSGKEMPFLEVLSTDEDEIGRIVAALKAHDLCRHHGLDVEWGSIGGFKTAVEMAPDGGQET